jgi:CheY-like chemotaxis protein
MALILVAEDDEATRDVLCRFLQHTGHTVRGAANGDEALLAALDEIPDLIISDVMMPKMTGVGLLEVLRSYLRLKDIPVILWTGVPDMVTAEHLRDLNVSALFVKSKTQLEDLADAIDRVLGTAKRTRDQSGEAGRWASGSGS